MQIEKNKLLITISVISFFLLIADLILPGNLKIITITLNIFVAIIYFLIKFSKKIKSKPFIERKKNEINDRISIVKTIISKEKQIHQELISITIVNPENDNVQSKINGVKLAIQINQTDFTELLLPLNDNFTHNDNRSFEYLVKRQMENWKK